MRLLGKDPAPLPLTAAMQDRTWIVEFSGRYASWLAAEREMAPQAAPEKDFRFGIAPNLEGWDGYLKQHELGLATALLSAFASRPGVNTRIVDFGGGVGVHFLTLMKTGCERPISWQVVELPKLVEIGKSKWGHRSDISYIAELSGIDPEPDVLIASGVLQYIADASKMIGTLLALRPKYIVIDRMPFSAEPIDYVKRQIVGAGFYGVEQSRPFWVFSKEALLNRLTHAYEKVFAFEDVLDPKQDEFSYEGMFLQQRKS